MALIGCSRFGAVMIASILAVAASQAGAQQVPPRTTQTPTRDTSARARTGTAVISGRVVAADTSKPLRRARITVNAPELGPQPRSTTTDADGRYEIRDLPAGRYRINVRRSGYLPLQYGQRRALEQGLPLEVQDGQSLKDVDFVLPRMGVITGRVLDDLGEPIESVTVIALRLRFWEGRRQLVPTAGTFRTDDTGQYRVLGLAPGTYYVQATTRETWTVTQGKTEQTLGYAPTFFPGTTTIAQAARITVGVGQEVGAVDIPLVVGRAATISGTAIDSTGKPFTSVSLRDEVRGDGFASFGSAGAASVAGDGTFTIRNVPPGQYKLTANSRGSERAEAAILPLAVDGTDVSGITLVGADAGSVSGHIVTDKGVPPIISRIRVTLAVPQNGQADPDLIGIYRDPGVAEASPDGSFSIKGVFGRSRFRVALPEDWMVKSITHDGRDLTDQPIEIRSGETLAGVEIVITNRVSMLSGLLSGSSGAPTNDGTVIVFPEDATGWGEDSRLVRAARPDRHGRYEIKGLPAGQYLAIALEDVESGVWHDPEFLEALRARARKLSITDGGEHDLPLKLPASDR